MSSMGGVAKVIHVTPETKLGDLLDEAESIPVRVERGGVIYLLIREADDPWASYDPERLRAKVRQYSGILTLGEGDRLKAQIYHAREAGTRPTDRP
ncbi:MAG: hypothetical protein KatS3mg059_0369 [Thermomicrobiales bacterium]|nr:MAG: hypothetical protein KatS3mg059_0369 [Thermomicrobiales bacterium]